MHHSPSNSSPSGQVHVSWQGVGQVSGAVGLVQVAGHGEPHELYSWFAGQVNSKKLNEREKTILFDHYKNSSYHLRQITEI